MEKNKAIAKAMEYCARSEKSKNEVTFYLEAQGANPDDVDEIIERLVEEKFIDELRYARAYVADKYRFNSWGRKKISFQLKSKGIPSELISEAMEDLDPDQYYEHLKEQLEKKLGSIKGDNYYEKKSKLMRYATGKGYEMDLIYDAVDEILQKT